MMRHEEGSDIGLVRTFHPYSEMVICLANLMVRQDLRIPAKEMGLQEDVVNWDRYSLYWRRCCAWHGDENLLECRR